MLSDFAKISSPVLVAAVVSAIVSGGMFAAWVANRKRIAADTVGRAEAQALRLGKDAERDAETTKKAALLEAREKAHEVLMEAERQTEVELAKRAERPAERTQGPRTS